MVTLSREKTLNNRVLVVDGFSGGGKSAVYPLLQGLERVENVTVHGVYEYLCCAAHFGKVEHDAAVALLRMLTDLRTYDNAISREVNFRPSDFSSTLTSNLRETYIKRLFLPDGRPAFERISGEKPILHLMTHHVFPTSKPLFRALGDRLTFIEVGRHPLHLIAHWHSYVERYGADVGDFTMWIRHGKVELPWFVAGREEAYLRGNRMDKVILGIHALSELGEARRRTMTDEERLCYHYVPFESFVINPDRFIDRICDAIGSKRRTEFTDIARRQKIPRRVSNAGPNGIWSEKYGEAQPHATATEEGELARNWQVVRADASPESIEMLEILASRYEDQSAQRAG